MAPTSAQNAGLALSSDAVEMEQVRLPLAIAVPTFVHTRAHTYAQNHQWPRLYKTKSKIAFTCHLGM